MQYRKDRKGEDISLLGFGCMRFTKKGTTMDVDKAEVEIMEAIRQGVCLLYTSSLLCKSYLAE